MMKIRILILCLALISLACLETTGAAVESPEPVQSVTSSAILITPTVTEAAALISPTAPPRTCAVVVAMDALHLRGSASLEGEVLTWLHSGDVVIVLDASNAEWWRVRVGELDGFARSIYLEAARCGHE